MRLILRKRTYNWGDAQSHASLLLSADIKGDVLQQLTVRANDVVAAELEVGTNDEGCEYFLQLGGSPDIRPFASRTSGKETIVFRNDGSRERNPFAFRLFSATIGTSYLYLGVGLEDGRIKNCPVAIVTVIDEGKGPIYDRMVASLLDAHLPHFCIDDFKWQMAKNRFSLNWEAGYTSYANQDVMLSMVAALVKKISPYVYDIIKSPCERFIGVMKPRSIGSVRRIDARTRREILKALRILQTADLTLVQGHKIRNVVKTPTFDIPANRAISAFLRMILRRLLVISDGLAKRLQTEPASRRDDIQHLSKHSAKNISADVQAVVDSLNRKLALARALILRVYSMLDAPVFSVCREDLPVFDLSASVFSSTKAYSLLYCAMLDYLRICYWWVGDKSPGKWKIPALSLAENGLTMQQLKYSTVFENWCYSRLVLAILGEGFVCESDKTYRNEDGSSCCFRKGTLHIKLVHGITAKRRHKERAADFELVNQDVSLLTPDFAVIVSESKSGACAWFVADAKSDDVLREHMVKARNRYASSIGLSCEAKPTLMPFASVLIRSGEGDGDLPGIEIPPPPYVKFFPTSRSPEERVPDHADDDYKWSDTLGIVEGQNDLPPYHGHLRVNVDSLRRDPMIVRRFIRGMVATAIMQMAGAVTDIR